MTVAVGFHILVIIGCYVFIVRTVFDHEESLREQAKKMNVTSLRANADQQQLSAECRAAKVAIINVTLWIVAWAPFMINAMFGVWGDPSFINPIVSEIPVLFAILLACGIQSSTLYRILNSNKYKSPVSIIVSYYK